MSAQPLTVTPEMRAEWEAFAEKVVRTVHLHEGLTHSLRLSHTAAAVEVGVLRMALMREDLPGALEALGVLARIHGAHAYEMGAKPLPAGVASLDEARAARALAPLLDGGVL